MSLSSATLTTALELNVSELTISIKEGNFVEGNSSRTIKSLERGKKTQSQASKSNVPENIFFSPEKGMFS